MTLALESRQVPGDESRKADPAENLVTFSFSFLVSDIISE